MLRDLSIRLTVPEANALATYLATALLETRRPTKDEWTAIQQFSRLVIDYDSSQNALEGAVHELLYGPGGITDDPAPRAPGPLRCATCMRPERILVAGPNPTGASCAECAAKAPRKR